MKRWLPVLGLVLLTVILTREFLPRRVEGPPSPPRIVTVRDTVRDTLRLSVPKPGKVTTDTLQIVIRETIHDTTVIQIGPTPEERTNVWPVLAVTVGKKVGDTTTVTTFGLRTGQGAVAKLWTPGPLLGLWVDSTATPRIDFGPPPRPSRTTFFEKVKWAAIGAGSYMVVSGITGLVHGR